MDNKNGGPPPQKNNKLKIIALVIGLLLIVLGVKFYLGLRTNQAPDQGINPPADQINVTLNINTGQNSYQFQESMKKDSTVLDLLKNASANEKFALDIKDSSMGAYIDGIYGINGDAKASKYWTFMVNSKFSNLGADQYMLSDGDVVEWIYGKM